MSLKTREQAIKSFDLDDDVKIMLISNVGTTGLNMVMASILILLVSAAAELLMVCLYLG